MIKLITTEDQDLRDIPVQLMDVGSRGVDYNWSVKRASVLTKEMSEIKPEKGRTMIHVLAVGDTESYGPNRNGDGFSREWNKKAHSRFVKHGNVFKHHQNKDPSKAVGQIKLSAHNDEMDRIELVISLDNEKCANEIQRFAQGKDLPVSMGCKVAFDVCLSPETQVLTPDGPRQMQDLTVGDQVISHTGVARTITHVYTQSHERSSRVIRAWGAVDSLHATNNHPLYVLPAGEATANQRQYRRKQVGGADTVVGVVGYAAPDFVPAEDVTEDDFLLYPVIRGSAAPTIDPWIAGLALGDGSVFGSRRGRNRDGEWRAYGIQFSLGLDKYEIVEHLLRKAGDLGYSAKVYPEPGKAAVSVHVRSRRLAEEFLRLFGRTQDKHLSGEVLQWSPTALRSLIGGWLDADGSQDVQKGSLRGATVLPAIARGIWQAAAAAGVPCAAHWENTTSEWAAADKVCMLHFQAVHATVLSEYSVRIQASDRRAKNLCFYFEHEGVEYLAMPIRSIEKSTISQTLNFGVEEDESYVASFAAVHNCSICGHKAPSPAQYCDHAKTALSRILDDGRQVYVDNPDPGYFELSLVGRPADRQGYGFRKVASSGGLMAVSSVELAKEAGLWLPVGMLAEQHGKFAADKLQMLRKLAEIEKEIETSLTPVDEAIGHGCGCGRALQDETIDKIHNLGDNGMASAFGGLSEAKVLLPLEDFLRLVNRKGQFNTDEVLPGVSSAMPGCFSRMLEADPMEAVTNSLFDGASGGGLPSALSRVISGLIPDFGLGEEPLNRRVTLSIIRPPRAMKLSAAPRVLTEDPLVQGLAQLYASYKLAFAANPTNRTDSVLTRAVVIENYTQP